MCHYKYHALKHTITIQLIMQVPLQFCCCLTYVIMYAWCHIRCHIRPTCRRTGGAIFSYGMFCPPWKDKASTPLVPAPLMPWWPRRWCCLVGNGEGNHHLLLLVPPSGDSGSFFGGVEGGGRRGGANLRHCWGNHGIVYSGCGHSQAPKGGCVWQAIGHGCGRWRPSSSILLCKIQWGAPQIRRWQQAKRERGGQEEFNGKARSGGAASTGTRYGGRGEVGSRGRTSEEWCSSPQPGLLPPPHAAPCTCLLPLHMARRCRAVYERLLQRRREVEEANDVWVSHVSEWERERESWAKVILSIRIYVHLIQLTLGPKSSPSVYNGLSQTCAKL
jgi:hypothetical protein